VNLKVARRKAIREKGERRELISRLSSCLKETKRRNKKD